MVLPADVIAIDQDLDIALVSGGRHCPGERPLPPARIAEAKQGEQIFVIEPREEACASL